MPRLQQAFSCTFLMHLLPQGFPKKCNFRWPSFSLHSYPLHSTFQPSVESLTITCVFTWLKIVTQKGCTWNDSYQENIKSINWNMSNYMQLSNIPFSGARNWRWNQFLFKKELLIGFFFCCYLFLLTSLIDTREVNQEALTVEEKLSADLFCAVMPISAHALPASREICS